MEDMNMAWLTPPIQLHSSREFMCMDFTEEQCAYYQYRWRFWYIADYVYALPTVAFFLTAIGLFVLGHAATQVLGYRQSHGHSIWQRAIAGIRYLSYRGFHFKALGWNSAPVGVLLLAAAGVVFFFCMTLIPQPYYWESLDWGSSPPLATRAGWMALACMPFIFATASKTNWITLITGVSHEKLQMFHRWTAYAFFVLALIHTFPFIVFHIRHHDMVEQVKGALIFYWTGIVALILQAWLTFASFGPFRSLGYEFFKMAHFTAAAIFVVIFFWHCDYTLTSWDYFIATAAVYVPCWVYGWLRTLFEYGGGQKAQVVIEENGFTRVTIPANFDWVPGQHCFLRFRGLGLHAITSHPFTICSLPSTSPDDQSMITFYIRHRGGFTARLYNLAKKQPGFSIPVMVDGPYGGIDPHKYYNSDRLVVVAGGSGAGWILPFIEQFARSSTFAATNAQVQSSKIEAETSSGSNSSNQNSTTGNETQQKISRPLSLRVILAARDAATCIWFVRTVNDLLAKYPLRNPADEIDIQVHTTGEAEDQIQSSKILSDSEESASGSDGGSISGRGSGDKPRTVHKTISITSRRQHGRPPLPVIIEEEASRVSQAGQSLGVYVCGPETMQNDVRNAVAQTNLDLLKNGPKAKGVYLHTEHFSWA